MRKETGRACRCRRAAGGRVVTGSPFNSHDDMANPVTVKGAVKRFEWTNPHAFIYLDVTDEKGMSWSGRSR